MWIPGHGQEIFWCLYCLANMTWTFLRLFGHRPHCRHRGHLVFVGARGRCTLRSLSRVFLLVRCLSHVAWSGPRIPPEDLINTSPRPQATQRSCCWMQLGGEFYHENRISLFPPLLLAPKTMGRPGTKSRWSEAQPAVWQTSNVVPCFLKTLMTRVVSLERLQGWVEPGSDEVHFVSAR